ncbi:glycosyltransferase family 4 protein (plasmid) [Tundrisphaera sp. TA3]|uniref:glycosyltransferase family 4 protein n=1 Tax=Tundrisphaera sp. TA3 TaxID=3435775 RepID=UPI003EBD88EA
MRILIATHHLAIVGGVETYLRAVLPLLAGAGHEIGVLTDSAPADGPGGILAGIPDAPIWSTAGRPIPALIRDLAGWRPDVVYAQGLADPDLEEALARAFPAVLFAHNYYGACISGTKSHAGPDREVCRRSLGPGCLAAYFPRRCGGLNPLTLRHLYRAERKRQGTLQLYRGVMVASRHMADEYRRAGVPPDRVWLSPLFPPGCRPDPDPPRPRASTGRVLMAGRLTRLKGADHLIEALPRASERLGRPLTLVVAGDGPERARLEQLADRARLPAEFRGWVSAADRETLTRGADLIAVPSIWPEPFGLVGIEAGCTGTPAVGYALGGIPDWLVPGVSGESALGDRPEPGELAGAIVRALGDDDHRNRLRRGAWEMAGRFSPEAHLGLLCHALERAASGTVAARV